jgi:hypothetical protein
MNLEEKERRRQKRKQDKYNKEHKIIDEVNYKICNKHHKYFPEENCWFPSTVEYFYENDKNSIDGLSPSCKRCDSKRSYENQKKDLEKHYIQQRKYYKEIRKTRKKTALRTKKRRESGKYDEWLKSEAGKRSSIKSREKRKLKEHVYYEIEWENLKRYFDYNCCYCGLSIKEHWIKYRGKIILGDFHKDHAIDQGRNDIKNMLPACGICNSEKHNKTLHEFYSLNNPNYTRERYLKIVQWLKGDYKLYILPKRRYKGQRMTERLKEVELNRNRK